jgi:tetratricopeptide (TPR) repeat protein
MMKILFFLLGMTCFAANLALAGEASAETSSETTSKDGDVMKSLRFKVGDEDGNEVKALKTEMLVIGSEKKALAQLQKLLKTHKGTRLEPELLVRLAEMYMRRARSERFFEVHRTSEQVLSVAPQLVKDASEAAEIRNAIAIYKRIQAEFPDFSSMDLVLFNNAYAYQQLGEDSSAEKLYSKLAEKFQDSPLVADSRLSMGEILYKRKEFKSALVEFKKVRDYPEARVYPYAIYKAAWSYYNLQDTASGLKELEEVVAFGRMVAEKQLDAKLDLRKEALNDMALFYSEAAPAEQAVSYFVAQAGKLDPSPIILRMVEIYKRHSQFQQIDLALRGMLKLMPNSPSLASAHEELIWNFERERLRPQATAQLLEFDKYCQAQRDPAQKFDSKECTQKMTQTSQKLALKWHGLWKKKPTDAELASSAEQSYLLYLKVAATSEPEFNETRYSFAELLFQENKFRDASEQYAIVDVSKDQKMREMAPYAAIVSLEKAVDNKWNDQDEKRFQQLSDAYIQYNPSGTYVLDLTFKRAFIAYEKKRYDEAADLFYKIGWGPGALKNAASEKMTKAQDLYLDILNIKKDYKSLKEASSRLLNKEPTLERTKVIEKIYREAYFSEVQQIEEKGDLKSAIEAYKKFALENRQSDLSAKAWWNASQLQFRLGDAEGGAQTCYKMAKLFPHSETGLECLTKAASVFESMGRIDLAAKVLLTLIEMDQTQKAKWTELAADFLSLSGERSLARQMYMELAKTEKPSQAVKVYEKVAVLDKANKDNNSYREVETKIRALGIEPQASRVVVELAEDDLASGDLTKAFNSAKKIIAQDSLPKNLLARARFVQAQVLADEFEKQSVKTRLDRVATVLALKTEKLEKAQKAYQSTVFYGDAETSVKALHSLSMCYLHYVEAIRNLQLSDQMSAQERVAFKNEIEKLAIPMEEKGIDSLAQALEAAKKFQLQDGTVASLQNELDHLNMKKTNLEVGALPPPTLYVPHFEMLLLKPMGRSAQMKVGTYAN